MVSTYTIDANDYSTEQIWNDYKQAQYNVRDQVGVVYRSIRAALGQYNALGERLATGDLAPIFAYHVASAGPLLDSEQALIDHLTAATAIIEQLQAARPGVFPGVPIVNQVNTEQPTGPTQAAAFAVLG